MSSRKGGLLFRKA